uniref:CYCZM2W n=1 Tax=Arundo donax TaxID=35708 RepID=A0A0A9GXV9_ARUDO
MKGDCTPAVIAPRHNWLGTPDAKLDPVQQDTGAGVSV